MIQELVDFCHNSFSRDTKGAPCDGNPFANCSDCLKDIHFNKDSLRKYDCLNMCHWYVCQDIYRYATEMAWLFHDKELGLKKRVDPLNICSIGCGPCSELIAFEEYRRRNGLTFNYSYTGFDFNDVWRPIQQKVVSFSSSPDTIRINNCDVFDYYDNVDERPNMIILNYMLSDMLKYRQRDFDSFINKLCRFAAELPSFSLLINDINSGRDATGVRYHYEKFIMKIRQLCGRDSIRVSCHHFADSLKNYFIYGEQRAMNGIIFSPPKAIVTRYETNTECHSAQLTIIKE